VEKEAHAPLAEEAPKNAPALQVDDEEDSAVQTTS
jgi:hypothetical protein